MRAAFFDLDKTVIAKASMLAFGRTFYKEGLLSRRTIMRSAYAQVLYKYTGANERQLQKLRETVLSLTKGWEKSLVSAIVSETMTEIVEPLIFKEALDLIEEHKKNGDLVFIVSASPSEIVVPLGERLAVDGVIATISKVDADGRYTGEMEFYAYGPYKAEAMQKLAEEYGFSLEESYAYSDSYTDLPMLEAVGNPVVVNPDRVLAKIAKDRSWKILSFTNPVRVREGRVRPSTPTALVALTLGIASVAASSFYLLYRVRRLSAQIRSILLSAAD
ncbi:MULTISPECIES: HAD-IB family hydrolase [Acidithrix]|uniref:Haloacid dehalogenase-like hydrolase n=1 Tax=Acidithrix ferrooxidans TaxID=1280514 RepID=A0A0D8HLP1_9ACTN|nr:MULTISPECIES: HAD-IB family hydrolase [Acidithrix]KJF18905.1 haloacid dehalogenase-like hydrolase [Acidithrix ferrooxidans]